VSAESRDSLDSNPILKIFVPLVPAQLEVVLVLEVELELDEVEVLA
jgi:hypothetical protein